MDPYCKMSYVGSGFQPGVHESPAGVNKSYIYFFNDPYISIIEKI